MLQIFPSSLEGEITIPSSKSHTMRALIFAAMAEGQSCLNYCLDGLDTLSLCLALEQLGARVIRQGQRIEVEGVAGSPRTPENLIDAGNSGQLLRFVSALAALIPGITVVTGDASIRYRRIMQPLLSAIGQLQGEAFSTKGDGYAPVVIRGPVRSGFCHLEGVDSQPVSALMMAMAFAAGKTEIAVHHPQEVPWLCLTKSWLQRMGCEIKHTSSWERIVLPGGLCAKAFHYSIPGDWSSAAFVIGSALTTRSALYLRGLDPEDVQGDRSILQILQQIGVPYAWEGERLFVDGRNAFEGGQIDMQECIDALPLLASVACFAQTPMRLVNAASARFKESDRLSAMQEELQKMGASIEIEGEGLRIEPRPLRGAALSAHADHRVALALAVAAMGAKGSSTISGWQITAKSYPHFISDFMRLGAKCQIAH